MKQLILSCLVAVICSACAAQDDGYKEPGPASQAYHAYRAYSAVPPYGLQRVRQLIKAKTVRREIPDSDDAGTDSLPEKLYQTLSLREKFTYNAIYGESFSQNCDGFFPVADEEKKIFGNIPDVMGDQYWSSRQIGFFKDNKDSVIALMTESIGRTKRVGVNYKHIIFEINATSMIPFLLQTYNLQKRDHDILTLLMLLMKKNDYAPFSTSASYRKLYGSGHDYDAALNYNAANEALIIQRATDFYTSLAH